MVLYMHERLVTFRFWLVTLGMQPTSSQRLPMLVSSIDLIIIIIIIIDLLLLSLWCHQIIIVPYCITVPVLICLLLHLTTWLQWSNKCESEREKVKISSLLINNMLSATQSTVSSIILSKLLIIIVSTEKTQLHLGWRQVTTVID